jgi:hypothetical protein
MRKRICLTLLLIAAVTPGQALAAEPRYDFRVVIDKMFERASQADTVALKGKKYSIAAMKADHALRHSLKVQT